MASAADYMRSGLGQPAYKNTPLLHHHIRCHRVPSGDEDEEDKELDPRIQVELEKLNRASEDINRLEMELDDARGAFRQVLSDSTQCLNALAKKLGACVDKARPYYDARMRLKEAHLESQKAVLRFERSRSLHEAAREMVQLAEEGYKRRELDPAWQEMLNHATVKVNDAERERIESEQFHQKMTLIFKHKEEEVHKLQKYLKKVIIKSRPYFEAKEKFNQIMADHKNSVSRLEDDISLAKTLYSHALHSLEAISDGIHQQRFERRQKLQLGIREAGVGAEAPSLPPSWGKGIEGCASPHGADSDKEEGHMYSSCVEALDVTQLEQSRFKSAVYSDPGFPKMIYLKDPNTIRGSNCEADTQGAAVFKTSLSNPQTLSYSPEHTQRLQPFTVDHAQQNTVQSSDCQGVIKSSKEEILESSTKEIGEITEEDSCYQSPNSLLQSPNSPVQSPAQSKSCHVHEMTSQGLELNSSGSSRTDSSVSESLRQKNIELTNLSLNCIQEQANKSPICQQERYVISKSLSGELSSSLSDSHLSFSLTAEKIKDKVIRDSNEIFPSVTQDRAASLVSLKLNQQSASSASQMAETNDNYHPGVTASTRSDEPLLPSSTIPGLISSQKSIGSLESPLDKPSPMPGSLSTHGKPLKLRGLILQIDAAGTSLSSRSSIHQSAELHSQRKPKVLISTQHPILGVFTEKLA